MLTHSALLICLLGVVEYPLQLGCVVLLVAGRWQQDHLSVRRLLHFEGRHAAALSRLLERLQQQGEQMVAIFGFVPSRLAQ